MKVGTNPVAVAPIAKLIDLPEEKAVLVNLTEQEFYGERTYGTFRILGRKPGEPYSTLEVTPRRGLIDMGDNSWSRQMGRGNQPDLKSVQQFVIKAEDIAVDLVREWNTNLWGIGNTTTGEVATETVRGFAGVFVCDGLKPTDQELEQARMLLAASDQALVERAHAEWDQFHMPNMIHASWKRSARRLGVDAEWLYTVSNIASLPDCPFCGSKLKTKTATVCATCHRDITPAEEPAQPAKAKHPKKTAAA
jgi:hypothetical protein